MSRPSSDPIARARSLANLEPAPPAASGNQLARAHGGYAEVAAVRLDAKARSIYDAIAADAPLRDSDGAMQRHDSAMVALLATTLCRLDSVGEHLAERGMFDKRTKRVRPVVELESRLRKEAAGYMAELGLTPRSRVALGVDLARANGRTLGEELDAAQQAREAREAQASEAQASDGPPADAEATAIDEDAVA